MHDIEDASQHWGYVMQRTAYQSADKLTLARSGGLMQPSIVFLSWTPHRLENRAEIFHSLWGIFFATFGEKIVSLGQVTKL